MKKVLRALIIGTVGICLCGCGNTIPEMTEQEQELVVEYAANELLKFDKNHVVKLTELEEEEPAETPEEATPDKNQPKEEKEPEDKGGVTADDVTVIDQTGENASIENVSIEQFLGLSDAEISYTGYEIADSYPSDGTEEVYFFMEATENSQLLVLKFDLKNTADGEKEVNLADSQVRYKIGINGAEQNALTTMLLNDMAYYQGTLAAGESTELVVVGEIPTDQADQITDLALVMKSVDDTATISLN